MATWGDGTWGGSTWGEIDPASIGVQSSDDDATFSTPTPPTTSSNADETGDHYPLGHVPDHCDRATARLIWQYRDSARLKAMICALVSPMQSLEDELVKLMLVRDLDNAYGQHLDNWGELVSEPRGGLTDTWYRKLIKARMVADQSNGLASDLIAVARKVIDSARTLELSDVRDLTASGAMEAMLAIGGDAEPGLPYNRLFDILNDAKPSGMQLTLDYSTSDDDDTFTLGPDGASIIDASKGLSNDAQNTGGHFAGAQGQRGVR